METKYFIYDGVKSSDLGLYLVNLDSGMVEVPFFGGTSVEEEKLKNKLTPYHMGEDLDNIEFTIGITPLDKKWTPQLRNKLGEWLFNKGYKEMQFSDDMGKIFYAKPTEAPVFNLYSSKGYIEVTFVTNSPFAWTPIYMEEYDLTRNGKTTIIEIENKSNVIDKFFPKIQIKNTSGLTFMIDKETQEKKYLNKIVLKNLSNKGKTMIIDGFEGRKEIISFDNENEIILSDLYDSKPFLRFNREWLELVEGVNQIEVTGKCKIWTKMQFPILQ